MNTRRWNDFNPAVILLLPFVFTGCFSHPKGTSLEEIFNHPNVLDHVSGEQNPDGGGPGGPGFPPGGGGPELPPPGGGLSGSGAGFDVYEKIAQLEVTVPEGATQSFLFHTVLPVPESALDDPLVAICYFDIGDGNQPKLAQIRVHSKAPNGKAEILQVHGRLSLIPSLPSNFTTSFDLYRCRYHSEQDKQDHLLSSFQTPTLFFETVADISNSILIFAKDAAGYWYYRNTLDDVHTKVENWGDHLIELTTYDHMKPISTPNHSPPGPSLEPYDKFLGVMVNMLFREEDVFEFRLMFDNGAVRTNQFPNNDFLGTVFLEELVIAVPNQLNVSPMFHPIGSDFEVGKPAQLPFGNLSNHTLYSIIERRSDGKVHPIPGLGQFNKNLVFTRKSQDPSGNYAKSLARFGGLAFLEDIPGANLFTWYGSYDSFDNGVGRVGDLRLAPYHLDYVAGSRSASIAQIKDDLREAREDLEDAFENDHSSHQHGAQLFFSTGIRPLKPAGSAYGGGTGGEEIDVNLPEWMRSIYAHSIDGVLISAIKFAIYQHRQFDIALQADGEPARPGNYLQGGSYIEQTFYDKPRPDAHAPNCDNMSGSEQAYCQTMASYFPYLTMYSSTDGSSGGYKGTDKYGIYESDQTQARWVLNSSREAPYSADYAFYQSIDGEHLSRIYNHAMALAFFGYFPGRRMLKTLAANAEHTHSVWPASSGYTGENTFKAKRDFVDQWPQYGVIFGRDSAHRTRVMAANYSLESDEYRESAKYWFDYAVDFLADAQIPCNGGILSSTRKPTKGIIGHGSNQYFEEVLARNARVAMFVSVYRGTGSATGLKLWNVLQAGIPNLIHPMVWNQGHNELARFVAMWEAESDQSFADPSGAPVYCFDPVEQGISPTHPQAMPIETDSPCLPNCEGTTVNEFENFYRDTNFSFAAYLIDDAQVAEDILCRSQMMHGGSVQGMFNHLQDYHFDGSDSLRQGGNLLKILQYDRAGESNFCN